MSTGAGSQRERLLAVFRGEKPACVPWYADLGYWQVGRSALGTLPAQYGGESGIMALHRDLGVGRFCYAPRVYSEVRDSALFSHEEWREGATIRSVYHTPEGTLMAARRFVGGGECSAPTEWGVKGVADLPALCAWYEGASYRENYAAFSACDAEWGQDGYPFSLAPRTPLSSLLVEWAGVETCTYMSIDAPDEFAAALRRLRRAQDGLFQTIAAGPGRVVEITDNLTAEVQASLFGRYSFEYYLERVSQLHAAGKKVGVHIDGTLRGLLPQLPPTGLDFVEAVTPKPVGDMGFAEVRAAVGPECIVFGAVPGAMFAPPFAWPALRDHVRDAIRVLGRDGRFILGSADQVPPDGDIELVRRISEDVLSAEA